MRVSRSCMLVYAKKIPTCVVVRLLSRHRLTSLNLVPNHVLFRPQTRGAYRLQLRRGLVPSRRTVFCSRRRSVRRLKSAMCKAVPPPAFPQLRHRGHQGPSGAIRGHRGPREVSVMRVLSGRPRPSAPGEAGKRAAKRTASGTTA